MLFIAMCALAARLLVPAGYMPGSDGQIALSICSGIGATATVAIDVRKTQKHDQTPGQHTPCAFSVAAMPAISGAPPALLAAAFIYIVEQGVASDPEAPARSLLRLRPPLRGPPAV